MYLKVDLETYDLKQLNCKFDTIIIGKLNSNLIWTMSDINMLMLHRAAPGGVQQSVRGDQRQVLGLGQDHGARHRRGEC